MKLRVCVFAKIGTRIDLVTMKLKIKEFKLKFSKDTNPQLHLSFQHSRDTNQVSQNQPTSNPSTLVASISSHTQVPAGGSNSPDDDDDSDNFCATVIKCTIDHVL